MPLRPSSLELLEARIAPAGVVKISVANGTVTVTGDEMGNQITITPMAPDILEFTATGGTHIHFGAVDSTTMVNVAGYTKDLKVALGGGADSITIGAGNFVHDVTLDGGTGANGFTYGGITVAGSFNITAREGTDSLTATNDISIGHDYSIKLGNGANNVSHQVDQLVVNGKLTVLGGNTDDGFDFRSINTTIGGNVSLNTGKGVDSLTFSATQKLSIYGKLDVAGGEIGVPSNVLGGVSTNLTTSAGDLFSVRGNVTFTTKNQTSGISFGGTNSLFIGGALSVKTGNSSTISLSSAVDYIGGNVSFKTEGFTTLNFQPSTGYFVGGKFSYTGDAGPDNINMVADGTIVGNATFSLGDGTAQTLNFGGATGGVANVLGALSIKSSEKNPPPAPGVMGGTTSSTSLALLFVGGKFSLSTGASSDTVTMDDFVIRGKSSISTGAGADHLNVETMGLPGTSEFDGVLLAGLGSGDDDATFGISGNGNSVIFKVASTLDAGPGTDSVRKVSPNLTVKNDETV